MRIKRKHKEDDHCADQSQNKSAKRLCKSSRCKSCGADDHLRSSSRKCPEYRAREGKEKPVSNNGEQWLEKTDSTYKTGFRSLLRDKSDDTGIEARVNNLVKQATLATFEASRLLQLHLQALIEAGRPIPVLDRNYLRLFYAAVQMQPVDDPLLMTSARQYHDARGHEAERPTACTGQVLTYLVKDHLTMIDNHIEKHFASMARKWLQQLILRRLLPPETVVPEGVRKMKHRSVHYRTRINEEADKKTARKYARHLAAELLEQALPSEQSTSPMDVDDEEDDRNDDTWKTATDFIRSHRSTAADKLRFMYFANDKFVRWGVKTSSLVPIFTSAAKHVTVDTDVLHDLLGGARGTGVDKKTFGRDQIRFWRQTFKFPERLIPSAEPLTENEAVKKRLHFMLKTDGVSCSVLLSRWIRCEKWTEAQKEAARKDRERQSIEDLLRSEGKKWIGIDPGRKDLMSSTRETLGGPRDPTTNYSVSNKQYYSDSKMTERMHRRRVWERQLDIHEWSRTRTTVKTHSSDATLGHVRQVFTEDADKYNRLVQLEMSRKARHARHRVYIHKTKTLDAICKRLLDGDSVDEIVVAYGDASFNHTSKGHAPSPRRLALKRRLVLKGVTVVDVREYNSSQVCSSCHHPVKMVGAGTKQDRELGGHRVHVSKSHFVRRCQSCRTIWNRDHNAARNMLYLGRLMASGHERPWYFRQSLPKQ